MTSTVCRERSQVVSKLVKDSLLNEQSPKDLLALSIWINPLILASVLEYV